MQRRTTNTVHVGDIAIGSGHPIAVQSMLCAAPSDVAANVAQALALKRLAVISYAWPFPLWMIFG